jgi:N4-gp56 family major capsid protein
MTVTQSSTLSNSLRIQYLNDYIVGAMKRRFYDVIAAPIDELSAAAGAAQSMADLCKGGTVRITFLSDMAVSTTPLSEVSDITPQVLSDATSDVTVDMFGDGIQTSQKALIQYFTNYGSSSPQKVGMNMMDLVEFKAMEAALSGSLVHRAVARSSLNAATTTNYASDGVFANVAARLSQFSCPGWEGEGKPTSWVALMDHFVLNDIARGTNGTIILNVAQYQDKDMVLNNEVGRLHSFRIVPSGFAKILIGAGLDNSANSVGTTLTAAAARLAKTISVADCANLAAGTWVNLITAAESGTTYYPENERAKVVSISSTTSVVLVGQGPNGGLQYAHPAGTTVTDDDSVHVILFGGPSSLSKVWAPSIGEFGELVGPKQQGLANQWTSFAWKWFGGYGRVSENWLYRGEFAVSEEA